VHLGKPISTKRGPSSPIDPLQPNSVDAGAIIGMAELCTTPVRDHKRPRLEPIDITEPPAKRAIGDAAADVETPKTRRAIDAEDDQPRGDPDADDDPAIGAVGPLCFDGDDEFGLRLEPTLSRAPAGVHFRRRIFNRFDAPTHDEPFDDYTMTTGGAARAPLSFEADDVPTDDDGEAGDSDDDEPSHAHKAARALEYSSDSDGALFSSDDDEHGAQQQQASSDAEDSDLGESDTELASDELAESLGWR